MNPLLLFLIHISIIGGTFALGYFTLRVCLDGHNKTEQLIRLGMAAVSVLIYVLSKTFLISIPNILISAASTTSPILTGMIGSLASGLSSWFIARYFLKTLRSKSDNITQRMIILISGFFMFLLADCYVLTWSIKGNNMALLMPNVAFIVGVFLYIAFNYENR